MAEMPFDAHKPLKLDILTAAELPHTLAGLMLGFRGIGPNYRGSGEGFPWAPSFHRQTPLNRAECSSSEGGSSCMKNMWLVMSVALVVCVGRSCSTKVEDTSARRTLGGPDDD